VANDNEKNLETTPGEKIYTKKQRYVENHENIFPNQQR
jgi:hypothetical protein